MFVDTHVHLYSDAYDADRAQVVSRARQAGVDELLLPAVDVESITLALELGETFPGVHAMAGLHPTYLTEAPEDAFEHVESFSLDPRIVAIGETGLDYYWSRDHMDLQQRYLASHARLAIERDLPIVLHNRDQKGSDDCARDIVRILTEARDTVPGGERLRGVFHCFGGPSWLVQEVRELDFYVGIGGTLTFKNAGVAEAIADIALDRIILETDGPYLAPTPHRGGRNEPSYVPLVAQALAEARGITVEEVAEQTTRNAFCLFDRLPGSARLEQSTDGVGSSQPEA